MRKATSRTLYGLILIAASVLVAGPGCGKEEDSQPADTTKPKPPPKVRTDAPKTRPAPAPATQSTTAPAAEPPKPAWTPPKKVTMEESFRIFRRMNPAPAILVPRVKVGPSIDGQRDPEYDAVDPVELSFLDGRTAKPTAPTKVWVVTTDTDLYVFFECFSPDMKALKATEKTHDEDVWQDDCVELFLDPTGGRHMASYYQITINPLGTTYEAKAPKAGGGKGWDPKMRVMAKVGEKAWTVEMAIPFAELGTEVPYQVWAANLNRMARLADGTEDTAWCPTGGDDSHVPQRFGTLWLEAGKINAVDYARWTGPRHVYSPPPRPMFRFAPTEGERILKAQNVTPNADETGWYGQLTLASNSEALLIVADENAWEITSLHGWRPIHAKWVNPKMLYVWRDTSDHGGYYALFDLQKRQVVEEMMYTDGTDIWEKIIGRPAKAD